MDNYTLNKIPGLVPVMKYYTWTVVWDQGQRIGQQGRSVTHNTRRSVVVRHLLGRVMLHCGEWLAGRMIPFFWCPPRGRKYTSFIHDPLSFAIWSHPPQALWRLVGGSWRGSALDTTYIKTKPFSPGRKSTVPSKQEGYFPAFFCFLPFPILEICVGSSAQSA